MGECIEVYLYNGFDGFFCNTSIGQILCDLTTSVTELGVCDEPRPWQVTPRIVDFTNLLLQVILSNQKLWPEQMHTSIPSSRTLRFSHFFKVFMGLSNCSQCVKISDFHLLKIHKQHTLSAE